MSKKAEPTNTISNAVEKMTDDQKKMLMSAINAFGDGNHPAATENTLPHFTKSYTKTICEKASERVLPQYKATLDEIAKLIN